MNGGVGEDKVCESGDARSPAGRTPLSAQTKSASTTAINTPRHSLSQSRVISEAKEDENGGEDQDQKDEDETVEDVKEDLPFEERTTDFGFLPIPKRLRWNPDKPPELSFLLIVIFGLCSTFTVANLYYPQPMLIVLAKDFNVSYEEVVNIPTLLQASYACGLGFICPIGDLVRRRELLLVVVFCAMCLTLGLALCHTILPFQILCFFLGLVTVTPQVMLPFVGDLAKPDRRASAFSVVLAGILLGLLFGRLMAGVIAEYGAVSDVYWMSFGLHIFVLVTIYFSVPDIPSKNKHLRYIGIITSMLKLAVTEPVLIQSYLIGFASSATFACFWTSSTFLLGEVYHFNSLQIGLFALVGVLGVGTAPLVGKLVDRLVPWTGVFLGISTHVLAQSLFTAAAGLSYGTVIACIFIIDVGQQLTTVSNTTNVFAINASQRARLSAVYMVFVFAGQLTGTAAGTRVYLEHGYRASGGLCLGLLFWNYFILSLRGPHLAKDRWIGWSGGWELRNWVVEKRKREAAELELTKLDSDKKV